MIEFCNIKLKALKGFSIISLTYKEIELDKLGVFYIEEENKVSKLSEIKEKTGLQELMYLSTCNRVEFLVYGDMEAPNFIKKFYQIVNPNISDAELQVYSDKAMVYRNREALKHLFRVASSLDSLVVGEREIITQVRNAFELSSTNKISGDFIRLAIKKTIETAKKIYSETQIAQKPVSVVSLAYRELKKHNLKQDSRFLIIGAGSTIQKMAKYLGKADKFKNFVIFNRTEEKAENLASEMNGKGFGLEEIKNYKGGFDVLISCTGASEAMVSKDLYSNLLNGETDKKILVDLALPYDIDRSIEKDFSAKIIGVESLKLEAEKNLLSRRQALLACDSLIDNALIEFDTLYRTRKVELAMSDLPNQIKEIKNRALDAVFAKDIEKLDDYSRETLLKVLSYVEKKYIGVPIKMAKEINIHD
jgi:glutamyl-tRNA reductase